MSYHGVVYVDMQPLLYPGATQIRGAYKIHPFAENDYTTKTKRKVGIADEALRVVSYLYDRNFAVSPAKKDQKVADKKDNKKVIKHHPNSTLSNPTHLFIKRQENRTSMAMT